MWETKKEQAELALFIYSFLYLFIYLFIFTKLDYTGGGGKVVYVCGLKPPSAVL